ncbi:MAG: FAD binding domain-containing protein, partial [Saprospiraceae bacterium]
MLSFILNNDTIHTDMPPGMTVLDFVRYHKHLTGTKIGCREGDCGACTILVGDYRDGEVTYRSMTSCLMPLSNAEGKHIVTIEGINPATGHLTPVQKAMVEENGTQCGFCTVGFVVSLTGFSLNNKSASQEAAIASIDGNICRCTGYKSIERASTRLINLLNTNVSDSPTAFAIAQKIVPTWFADIKDRLKGINASTSESESNEPIKKYTIVSGGTDLYVQRPEDMVHSVAINVFNRNSLKEIREVDGHIEIGAEATVTDLLESPIMNEIFPKLKQHLKLVSSTPIRNMATIAGNLVNASPIGDMTVWFLALDATVVVRNQIQDAELPLATPLSGNSREIPLRDFYEGYKKLAKTDDEIVEKIYFKKPDHCCRFNFEKVSKRTFLDIATVNTAMFLRVEDELIVEAHISAGGVGPIPLYLKNTSSCLLFKLFPFD